VKPFDEARANARLKAFVVVALVLIAAAGEATCIYHADAIVAGKFKCDADNKLTDLLLAVIAIVAVGQRAGRPPPDHPHKDESQ
jgi:hypothetical protein